MASPVEINIAATGKKLKVPTGLFINNEFVPSSDSKENIKCYNPATEEVICEVVAASAKDVDIAVNAARTAFNTTWGKNVSGFERSRLINKLADLIERDAQELAELEALNNGKPVKLARHVFIPAFGADSFQTKPLAEISTLGIAYNVSGTMRDGQIKSAWKVAPALACGCTIVMKPSEFTPLTALWALVPSPPFGDVVYRLQSGARARSISVRDVDLRLVVISTLYATWRNSAPTTASIAPAPEVTSAELIKRPTWCTVLVKVPSSIEWVVISPAKLDLILANATANTTERVGTHPDSVSASFVLPFSFFVFPPGVVNTIPSYGSVGGAALSSHLGVDKVAFTGSTVTGRKIMESAAKSNLKKVSLELGGKSPQLVFESADIDQATNWAALGILYNTGQDCTAGSRVYVQDAIHDKFVATLIEKAKALVIGDGFDEKTGGGPVVSKVQYDKIWSYIDAGKQEGATCVLGGDKRSGKGYFVDPTIFTDIKPDMKIVKEEIFGPVLSVGRFSTEEEAIKLANDTTYGLGAGLHSSAFLALLCYRHFG
ncbi:hypothetical protein NLI96_g5659 [Meripilus lineatus]|uniref:Aldehyde dehydrogenase domain-containing protein n=1 Tax=Meripilus lineatus TaxID=2056292 RepID=A0AAD5V7C1_9APHY|nr:hypothetical protein NLI96_g5659 [Physisporinus lineatus]